MTRVLRNFTPHFDLFLVLGRVDKISGKFLKLVDALKTLEMTEIIDQVRVLKIRFKFS